MKEMLQQLRSVAVDAILNAADAECLESLRIQYLGKKGELTKLLKMMGKLDPADRPAMGQLANQVRAEVENAIAERRAEVAEMMLQARLEVRPSTSPCPARSRRSAMSTRCISSSTRSRTSSSAWASRSWRAPRSSSPITTSRS